MTLASAIARRLRAARDTARSPVFLRELLRTALAWLVLFIVGIWMVVCQQWSDMRWIRRLQQTNLYPGADTPWPTPLLLQDQLLEALPLLTRAWISDKLVGSSVIVCILGCTWMARGWQQRMMVVRRIAWMVAILYFLRSLTLSATTLPPSSPLCAIPVVPKSTWEVIKATPDILAGTIGQCTDKIFSGHTSILFISLLFWLRYARHWAFVAYSVVHCSVGVLTVLMARYHYTVDVLLGLLLTYFVHQAYYCALERAVRGKVRSPWGGLGGAQGEYSMDVFRGSVGREEEEGGDGWDERDSAFGVSGRATPLEAVDPPFVVRKRENTASAAMSEAEEAAAGGEVRHCEISVDEGAAKRSSEDRLFSPAHMEFSDFGPRLSTNSRVDEMLGINRPFGTLLPRIVAWMDGLDLRCN
ncbi:hypothetical protein LPJ53_003164 [Coemansia erecta]|uniref:Sphingomyelin synthase-like domain-containing protein n=1 Tax=Coemansia erecta TaxID=147472 RepID=A0A9W7Y0G3_9FUNG|nr:hypothetical protein LPJ53_003164 [Coemansia erecta]